jgi:hypothetical protein
MKQCFDALRKNKEEEKVMIMEEALNGDCMPAIEMVSKDIKKKEKQAVQSGRSRACKNIEKTLSLWVRSYFKKWKEVTQYKEIGMKKEMKDRLLRMFRQRMMDAFYIWKNGKDTKKIEMTNMTIDMSMEE